MTTPAGERLQAVVVVPCFNEKARLDLTSFETFVAANGHVTFLFVDDGSTDGTGHFITAGADRVAGFAALRLPRNRGKGEAVRAGLLHALESRPHVVGFWDADLSTPLDELPVMLGMLGDRPALQVVTGARVQLLGRWMDRHATRHYLGRVFATAASLILRMPVYDTQCGAKVFRVTPALESVLSRPFLSRWVFDVELLMRYRGLLGDPRTGWIEERPLRRWTDVPGSKLRPTDFIGVAHDLVRIWIDGRRDHALAAPAGGTTAKPEARVRR
jgi:dolichyl-phosphate beta-glucosyltransferase